MFCPRVLRRRWVLGVILGCSVVYFISSIYRQTRPLPLVNPISEPRIPPKPFKWQPQLDHINSTEIKTCRNSVQGKVFITDDRGYLCRREDLLPGGCCHIRAPGTKRFVCDTCLASGCCTVYEHCVSCCLQPEKQSLLRKILSKASDSFQHLFASVTDHFELCLAKCRTSSQVSEKICDNLAEKIYKQFEHPERKQIIFELMGQEFVQTYFPNEEFKPALLEPPLMTMDARKKMQLDAQNWLQNALSKVASETGCIRQSTAEENDEALAPEMENFLRDTRYVFSQGVNRHLYLREHEFLKKLEASQWERENAREERRESRERERMRREAARLRRASGFSVKSILKNAYSESGTSSPVDRPTTSNVKGAVFGSAEDPPIFWGMQSNSLGKSVMAMLIRDPRRFKGVVARLHGRQLPGSLRSYIWLDVLLKHEREKLNDAKVETVVRERFGKLVARGMGDLGIKRATHSPISSLIDNAVIEIYESTPSMRMFLKDNTHMKEAAKALNVLYVYNRSYEPYLITWLFPLQLAFPEGVGQSEHVYELAMYLDLLVNSCFPKWPQIFTIAKGAMSRLKQADVEFYDHLKSVSQKDAIVNPKDFLVHLIHYEKAKATNTNAPPTQEHLTHLILTKKPETEVDPESGVGPAEDAVDEHPEDAAEDAEEDGGDGTAEAAPVQRRGSEVSRPFTMSKELLADPLIFLRKWVGEAFVGVLDTQAAIFVWDQCFLQRWQPSVLEDFCLVVLLLLRYWFMKVKDYAGMKEVFLSEPCMLYTKDIQRAWIHVQNKGNLTEVEFMNRRRPTTAEPVSPEPDMAQSTITRCSSFNDGFKSPTLTQATLGPLCPVGIKNLGLELVIASESFQKESWLENFDPERLKLLCSVYFGGVKLQTKLSTETAVLRETVSDKYGGKTYKIEFPHNRFLFDDLDPSNFDVERELGAYPYAIMRVDYLEESPPGHRGINVADRLTTLGWARMELYKYRADASRAGSGMRQGSQWQLVTGEYKYPVYSGSVPDSLLGEVPATPTQDEEQGVLCKNSELRALVFEPSSEPETPLPEESAPVAAPRPISVASSLPEETSVTVATQEEPEVSHELYVPGLKDTFDLYVDGIDHLPDNATVVKVTGRFIKKGQVTVMSDILGVPELDSSIRCPRFRYRYVVNEEKQLASASMLVLLRIYTLDAEINDIHVVGNCLFELFDPYQEKLKMGGHRRYLHHGMPDLRLGVDNIVQTSLDDAPRIPGCFIYFRLLEHSDDYIEPEVLDDQNYLTTEDDLNESETQVVETFTNEDDEETVESCAIKLHEDEDTDPPESGWREWIIERLDHKKRLPEDQPAPSSSLTSLFKYRQDVGLCVEIVQAYGLPEGLFIQCYAEIEPGQEAENATQGDWSQSLFTVRHDYDSLQKAPRWMNDPKVLQPYYDLCSCLIVRLYGLDMVYTPNPDHSTPGKTKPRKGGDEISHSDALLGWAVVPLFDRMSVHAGRHHVPIFKDEPDDELLQAFKTDYPDNILAERTWNTDNKYPSAGLVVDIWNAIFSKDEIPGNLSRIDALIGVLGTQEMAAYQKEEKEVKGKPMSQLVINGLETKYQKLGTNSSVYGKEMIFYEDVMNKAFSKLITQAG